MTILRDIACSTAPVPVAARSVELLSAAARLQRDVKKKEEEENASLGRRAAADEP
jgi:hypothetical protein